MARRRGQAPLWVQWLIVWAVVSGLSAAGLMYLRSRGLVGDALFQPLAPVLCPQGGRIDTAYGTRTEHVDDLGRSDPTSSRSLTYAALDAATCVSADGQRTDVTGRLTAAVIGLGGVAGATVVGLLALLRRR